MYVAQWDDSDKEAVEEAESFGINLNPLPEVIPHPDNSYMFTVGNWVFDLRDDTYQASVEAVQAWVGWVAFLKSREKVNGTLDAPIRIPEEYLE